MTAENTRTRSDLTDIVSHLRTLHIILILCCAAIFVFTFVFDATELESTKTEYAELKKAFIPNKGYLSNKHRSKMCLTAIGADKAAKPLTYEPLLKAQALKVSVTVAGKSVSHVIPAWYTKNFFKRRILCQAGETYIGEKRYKSIMAKYEARYGPVKNSKAGAAQIMTSRKYLENGLKLDINRLTHLGYQTDHVSFLKKLWNNDRKHGYAVTRIEKFDFENAFVMSYQTNTRVEGKLEITDAGAEKSASRVNSGFYRTYRFPNFAKTAGITPEKSLTHYAVFNFPHDPGMKDYALIIPVYTSKTVVAARTLWEKTYGMSFSKTGFGNFVQTFPFLNQLVSDNNTKSTTKLAGLVNKMEKEARNHFEIGGAKIEGSAVLSASVFILIVLLVYFWVFLRAFSRRYVADSCLISVPWIGMLPDKTSLLITIVTLVLLPMGTGIFQFMQGFTVTAWLSEVDKLATLGVLAFVCLLVFISLLKLHGKKAYTAFDQNIEEDVKKTAIHVRTIHALIVLACVVLATTLLNQKSSNIEPLKKEYREFTKFASANLFKHYENATELAKRKYREKYKLPAEPPATPASYRKTEKVLLHVKSEEDNFDHVYKLERGHAFIFRNKRLLADISKDGLYIPNQNFDYSLGDRRFVFDSSDAKKIGLLMKYWDLNFKQNVKVFEIKQLDLANALLVAEKERIGDIYGVRKKTGATYSTDESRTYDYTQMFMNFAYAAEHPHLVKAAGHVNNKNMTLFLKIRGTGSVYKRAVVIPLITRTEVFKAKDLFAGLYKIDFNVIRAGTFKQSFPLIAKLVAKHELTATAQIFPKIKQLEKETEGLTKINLFGAELGVDKLINIGSVFLVILMAYFWVFVRSLIFKLKQSQAAFDTAWLGLLPDRISLLLTLLSAVVLPIAVCLLQVSHILADKDPGSQIVSAVIITPLIIVSLLLMYNLIRLNSSARTNLKSTTVV